MSDDLQLRLAAEADLDAISEIFLEAYGPDYPYQEFYDPQWLRHALYNDDLIMIVAAAPDGRVLGTASVVFNIGTHSDLVGEFGRLAVHPDARGRGIGNALMNHRVQRVQDRLHVALVDNRTVHPYSQQISERFGFRPVGFMPIKHRFQPDCRESVATYARHFGPALELRKNHPRLIGDVATLAHLSMQSLQLSPDIIVDDSSHPYPADDDFQIYTLQSRHLPHLLRIERGRTRSRHVFGPVQLHQGFFKLQASHADYLVAHRPSTPPSAIQGALGYIHDKYEHNIRIVELIAPNDRSIHHLLRALLSRSRNMGVEYLEVDVSAYAPRLQRTLLDLDFVAAAYVPSMVFEHVQRLDVIRMARPLERVATDELQSVEGMTPFIDHVLDDLDARRLAADLGSALHRSDLFKGLDDDQASRLARSFHTTAIEAGEPLFKRGDTAHELFLIVDGEVTVDLHHQDRQLRFGPGQVVGENAMLAEQAHRHSARATDDGRLAILDRHRLSKLIHRRPDIGLTLYRNLAIGLGNKLHHTDVYFMKGRGPSSSKEG